MMENSMAAGGSIERPDTLQIAPRCRRSNRFPLYELKKLQAAFAFHSSGRRLRVEGVQSGRARTCGGWAARKITILEHY